ncbi:hypothetical protein TPA0910_13020 [Streptomyces hygroscopicus subsp. sporocinereus]|uniref:Transposase IS701-like DDE domain-containing protein n=1 Tax=Streptomyces hygroscopicus TaxID=1912 RepID=A0ABQ3TU61_STRHY|nr:hypothetical protein TPA0910_13020 [Streptomyces hygroscopicus]
MPAGDVTRLAWVLRGLPAELVGRVRPDRVMRLPKPPRMHGVSGRPPEHGPEFRFAKPETWPEPAITTVTDTTNYGKAETQAWDRVHPRLTHRSSWLDHEGERPLVEGTLIIRLRPSTSGSRPSVRSRAASRSAEKGHWPHLARCPTRRTAQVTAWRLVAHSRADALGDGVEQRLADIPVEPAIQRP